MAVNSPKGEQSNTLNVTPASVYQEEYRVDKATNAQTAKAKEIVEAARYLYEGKGFSRTSVKDITVQTLRMDSGTELPGEQQGDRGEDRS